jgi:hypothetical protein
VAPQTRTDARSKHGPAARLVEARGHYPVWSVKSIAWLSLVTVIVTAAIVAVSGKRSVLVEIEWTLGIVAAALFAMLSVGLYRGVRLKEQDAPSAELQKVDLSDWTPDTGLPDLDCPLDAVDGGGDELGCLGVIAGVLLAVVAFVVLTLLLWFFLQVAVIVMFIIMTAIYWVLHLALRQVFAHSQDCRGNLPRSLGYATLYTVLYTGWLFALLLAASAMRA